MPTDVCHGKDWKSRRETNLDTTPVRGMDKSRPSWPPFPVGPYLCVPAVRRGIEDRQMVALAGGDAIGNRVADAGVIALVEDDGEAGGVVKPRNWRRPLVRRLRWRLCRRARRATRSRPAFFANPVGKTLKHVCKRRDGGPHPMPQLTTPGCTHCPRMSRPAIGPPRSPRQSSLLPSGTPADKCRRSISAGTSCWLVLHWSLATSGSSIPSAPGRQDILLVNRFLRYNVNIPAPFSTMSCVCPGPVTTTFAGGFSSLASGLSNSGTPQDRAAGSLSLSRAIRFRLC